MTITTGNSSSPTTQKSNESEKRPEFTETGEKILYIDDDDDTRFWFAIQEASKDVESIRQHLTNQHPSIEQVVTLNTLFEQYVHTLSNVVDEIFPEKAVETEENKRPDNYYISDMHYVGLINNIMGKGKRFLNRVINEKTTFLSDRKDPDLWDKNGDPVQGTLFWREAVDEQFRRHGHGQGNGSSHFHVVEQGSGEGGALTKEEKNRRKKQRQKENRRKKKEMEEKEEAERREELRKRLKERMSGMRESRAMKEHLDSNGRKMNKKERKGIAKEIRTKGVDALLEQFGIQDQAVSAIVKERIRKGTIKHEGELSEFIMSILKSGAGDTHVPVSTLPGSVGEQIQQAMSDPNCGGVESHLKNDDNASKPLRKK